MRDKDWRVIKPVTLMDCSEAAVETALIDLWNATHKEMFNLILKVSVFDVQDAIGMMVCSRHYRNIRYVHVTPDFKSGEFSIIDEINKVEFWSEGA